MADFRCITSYFSATLAWGPAPVASCLLTTIKSSLFFFLIGPLSSSSFDFFFFPLFPHICRVFDFWSVAYLHKPQHTFGRMAS
ncbi:hypothetical protein V8C37DRAFT_138773 [Trichoderma ceciliae]